MTGRFEEMSREELVHELEKVREAHERYLASMGSSDREHLVHELHVHQVELEMQNRELREAQERVEEARERYADLYDFAPVGYATLDPDGVIQEINLTGAALLGAPRGDLIGRAITSYIAVEDRKPARDHLVACRHEQRRTTKDVTLSHGGRPSRVVQLISEPVVRRRSAVVAIRTILVDISAVKRLENRLRLLSAASELLARSLDRDATADAATRVAVPALADVCIVDLVAELDATITRAAVRIADPGKAALADRVKRAPLPPGWRGPEARVIATGEPMVLEVVPAGRDTTSSVDPLRLLDARSLMVVPLIARGTTIGAMTFAVIESSRRYTPADLELARDLANRVAQALDNTHLYAVARQASVARDAMLAVVSHDLRSPLNVIKMRASHARAMAEPETELHKAFDGILRTADRMTRLIQDLLDASSIEAGTFSVVLTRQTVKALFADACEALEPQASARSLTIVCDLPDDDLSIHGDRERLLQVLENLVGNAIKFSAPGGTITVRAEARGHEVHVAVIDRGPGIAASELPHVFDRFWTSREPGKAGTGLGLAIARGIVEAHRGRIWAESTPGEGSRFCFALPLAEPPARIALVVDDDHDTREAIGAMLATAGYEIVEAADGLEALDYLRSSPPPVLIVLDLMMPRMDGWDFLAQRAADPALRVIPVIAISGQGDIAERVTQLDASFLAKPVTPAHLIEQAARVSS